MYLNLKILNNELKNLNIFSDCIPWDNGMKMKNIVRVYLERVVFFFAKKLKTSKSNKK